MFALRQQRQSKNNETIVLFMTLFYTKLDRNTCIKIRVLFLGYQESNDTKKKSFIFTRLQAVNIRNLREFDP